MCVCRPVYKQDQGENYVYYSSAGQCWLVGCLVGHRYSWLRNNSQAAPLCRYPSLLSSGWQVRTDTGDWAEAEQDSITFHNIKGKSGQPESLVHYHWSSNAKAWLSLVESLLGALILMP